MKKINVINLKGENVSELKLNEEVEIIEESKEESKKVEPIDINEFLQIRKTKKILYLANKINEIIDRLEKNNE